MCIRDSVNTTIFQSHLKDAVELQSLFKDANSNLFDSEISASPIIDFDGNVDSFTIIVKPISSKNITEKPKEIVKEIIKEVFVEKPVEVETKTIIPDSNFLSGMSVSYTHLRAHETVLDLVCRLLLEKKKYTKKKYSVQLTTCQRKGEYRNG